MLNAIKQLKQQNEVAFNFALAGLITLLLAMSALVLLWHGLIEQRQIAKQVGDLQMIESRIETIVISKKLAVGEEKAFLDFEGQVNNFNQQWTELKQQYNYSDKTIKAVDVVWQRANSKAQMILSMKKEVMALRESFQYIQHGLARIYSINDELIKVLLGNNASNKQILLIVNKVALLHRAEKNISSAYYGTGNAVCMCHDFPSEHEEVAKILRGFLLGDSNYGIKRIEDKKAGGLIEQEMVLYQKIYTSINTFHSLSPEFFQVREARAAIYRDSPELKSTLAKLNNHQLNKGLIVFVVCVWLAFFVCVFGFLRALNTKHID